MPAKLADRREELTRQRIQTVDRLQRLLAELIPGKAKKHITVLEAKAILAPPAHRHFGSAASRTRKPDATADPDEPGG